MLWNLIRLKLVEYNKSILSDKNATIFYSELLDKVEKLGDVFKTNLINGETCAILCKSELNTAICLLALFKARITAVPLSLNYGELHCNKILNSINPNNIVTDDENNDIISKYKHNVYLLSGIKIKSGEKNIYNSELIDVAIIMCTSGTTGIPKGAMITYDNLHSNICDIIDYFNIQESDKILIARPLYHAAVLTGEFLVSLFKGLNIYFYKEEFNPIKIIEQIIKNNITVLCGTPTLLYHLCKFASRQNKILPLKTIVISGECLTDVVAELIQETMMGVKIYNVYGLTEAAPRVTYSSPELFKEHPLSVGVPLKSVEAKIIDENGNEVPAHIIGELVISGPNIMKGYYNNSIYTKEVLKKGWLYTGDVSYMDENGLIYIKSRKDNMIIRAGMNIYPQEIENELKKSESICDVLAYGVCNDKVGHKIHLKIVPSNNNVTKYDILNICKEKLPLYQIPDNIEFVEHLVRNGVGKIERPKREVFI